MNVLLRCITSGVARIRIALWKHNIYVINFRCASLFFANSGKYVGIDLRKPKSSQSNERKIMLWVLAHVEKSCVFRNLNNKNDNRVVKILQIPYKKPFQLTPWENLEKIVLLFTGGSALILVYIECFWLMVTYVYRSVIFRSWVIFNAGLLDFSKLILKIYVNIFVCVWCCLGFVDGIIKRFEKHLKNFKLLIFKRGDFCPGWDIFFLDPYFLLILLSALYKWTWFENACYGKLAYGTLCMKEVSGYPIFFEIKKWG